jgi:hypothetical protein
MYSPLRNRFRKAARWLGVLFVILFLFRLLYGYWGANPGTIYGSGSDYFGGLNNLRRNYASEKIGNKIATGSEPVDFAGSQKKSAYVKTI